MFLIADQFRKPRRIAVLLTVVIGLLVLVDRMEHIDRETHVEQVLVIHVDKVGEELAVVVEEDKRWSRAREVSREARIEKQLQSVSAGLCISGVPPLTLQFGRDSAS